MSESRISMSECLRHSGEYDQEDGEERENCVKAKMRRKRACFPSPGTGI